MSYLLLAVCGTCVCCCKWYRWTRSNLDNEFHEIWNCRSSPHTYHTRQTKVRQIESSSFCFNRVWHVRGEGWTCSLNSSDGVHLTPHTYTNLYANFKFGTRFIARVWSSSDIAQTKIFRPEISPHTAHTRTRNSSRTSRFGVFANLLYVVCASCVG